MIIRTRITNYWSEIPDVWKKIKDIGKVKYTANPKDAGLASIIESFTAEDDLRPAMEGFLFDDKNITATDAHRLMTIPNTGTYRGLYKLRSESKIDAKFPNYEVVIPESCSNIYRVEIDKLRCYLSAVIKGAYSNPAINAINIFFEEDFITFSALYLFELLDSFKMLGYDVVYIGMDMAARTRPVLFCGEKEYLKKTKSAFGKIPLALLMPIFAQVNEEGLPTPAFDIDFSRELLVKFDISKNQIIDSDGTVVEDWRPKTDGVPYLREDEISIIKKVTNSGSAKNLPILQQVKVENKVLTASNLETYYQVKGINIQDGMFELINGALVNQDDLSKIDDYPLTPNEEKETYIDRGKFGLNEEVKNALDYLSNDNLRPAMTGVHIHALEYNGKMKTYVEATNAHIIYSTMTVDENLLPLNGIISNAKLVSSALDTFNQRYVPLSISYNDWDNSDEKIVKYFKFENENYCLINRAVDNKYPIISNIKIESGLFTIRFDAKHLAKLLSGLKGKEKRSHILIENKKVNECEVFLLDDYNVKLRTLGSIECGYKNEEIKISENFVAIAKVKPKEEYNGFTFNASYLSTVMKQKPDNQHYFYLTAKNINGDVFFSNIEREDVSNEEPKPKTKPLPEPKPKQPKEQPVPKGSQDYTKKDLEDAIKALEILSKKGNTFAAEALRGLRTLLKTI